MAFERTFTLHEDGAPIVKTILSFVEHEDEPDVLTMTVYDARKDALAGQATWHVQSESNGFALQISTQIIPVGICLAGCFAGVISGPLVDCLRKARSRKDVRNCIDANAAWQAVSAMTCIYGCLSL